MSQHFYPRVETLPSDEHLGDNTETCLDRAVLANEDSKKMSKNYGVSNQSTDSGDLVADHDFMERISLHFSILLAWLVKSKPLNIVTVLMGVSTVLSGFKRF